MMLSMSEAVFGLIGVAVGALVTGVAEYLLEKRRDVRAKRTARRMLTLELEEAHKFIEGSLEATVWTEDPARVLTNDQWAEHRNVWGASVDDCVWEPIADAFMAIAEVRRSNRDAGAGRALNEGDERGDHVALRLRRIQSGLDSLDRD